MNGGITSVPLNTFNCKDLSRDLSPTFVILSLRNHVSDFQHLLCLFVWVLR